MGKSDSKLYAGLSYEQTVRKYAQNVSSACMMRLQNWADAEDCFQNTFIKLYQKSPDFKDENHLRAWLLRVAINECKNLLRDSRRHLSLDAALQLPAPSAEDDADLSWALMKLDPDYRDGGDAGDGILAIAVEAPAVGEGERPIERAAGSERERAGGDLHRADRR